MRNFSELNSLLMSANTLKALLKNVLLYNLMTASARFLKCWLSLRTTVPLISYIRNSLRFWYYVSLSTCCQNLEKNWGHRENLGESGGQTFKEFD